MWAVGRRPRHRSAHGPMTDEERDIRANGLLLHLVEVLGERRPARRQTVRAERERHEVASDRRDGRERVAAVAGELGREALEQVAGQRPIDEQRPIGVSVRVDEARRDDPTLDVELEADVVAVDHAEVPDGDDRVAEHADIGAPTGSPGAVDYGPREGAGRSRPRRSWCHARGDATRADGRLPVPWGYSSAGRAPAWHAGGPGFESP